jgi:sirohydrochlorin ferrochelatase
LVKVAFMQFGGPALSDVVGQAAAEGHRDLTLLPLFVASAGHVDKDIKPLVAELSRAHPDLDLHLMTPVGEDDLFPTFISNVFSRPSEPS